jgi:hypothetical protein
MRTQNPPPLKACRFDSDLGHHVNIRFGQGQVIAAAANNLNVLILFLSEYVDFPSAGCARGGLLRRSIGVRVRTRLLANVVDAMDF